MYDVVLTTDWTMMSNHHGKEFLGFGATSPYFVFPEVVYKNLFYPPMRTDKEGRPWQAPYGLRKVEAALVSSGINAAIIHPSYLDKYLLNAKALFISGHDYFGFGPPSSTFASILHKEPANAINFQRMMRMPIIKEAKKKGLKIIAGGPAAWHFQYREDFVKEVGIDTVVEGEGEVIAPKLVKMIFNNEPLPKHVSVQPNESPTVDQIPAIIGPSVNGIVEIGRGCPRGCAFCSVTLRPTRWYTYERIEQELALNRKAGIKKGILHSDDVYFYGMPSIYPSEEKVIKLMKLGKKYYDHLDWSHVAVASLLTVPKLLPKLKEIIIDGRQKWWGVEVGVETGSPELLSKLMPGKARPFKVSMWPEMVVQAAGLMSDNNVIPACTFIVGLPEETEDDINRTLDLFDDLWDFRAILVPMFFVPMGRLKSKTWFEENRLTEVQKEILMKALSHGIRQSRAILNTYFTDTEHNFVLNGAFSLFVDFLYSVAKLKGLWRAPKRPPKRITYTGNIMGASLTDLINSIPTNTKI